MDMPALPPLALGWRSPDRSWSGREGPLLTPVGLTTLYSCFCYFCDKISRQKQPERKDLGGYSERENHRGGDGMVVRSVRQMVTLFP